MVQLDQLERRVEAIIFACGEPIEAKKIAQSLNIELETVYSLVNRIKDKYKDANSPIDIVTLNEHFQMVTMPEYAEDIRTALELNQRTVLSAAAMEVLAIIAYNEPVTRAFVEEVRGVDCSSLIRGLMEKDLLAEAGRLNIPGKPIIYRTTSTFLRSFNMESLSNLPILPDSKEEDFEQIEGQLDFDKVTVPLAKEIEEE